MGVDREYEYGARIRRSVFDRSGRLPCSALDEVQFPHSRPTPTPAATASTVRCRCAVLDSRDFLSQHVVYNTGVAGDSTPRGACPMSVVSVRRAVLGTQGFETLVGPTVTATVGEASYPMPNVPLSSVDEPTGPFWIGRPYPACWRRTRRIPSRLPPVVSHRRHPAVSDVRGRNCEWAAGGSGSVAVVGPFVPRVATQLCQRSVREFAAWPPAQTTRRCQLELASDWGREHRVSGSDRLGSPGFDRPRFATSEVVPSGSNPRGQGSRSGVLDSSLPEAV